jgi:hypothetical protein
MALPRSHQHPEDSDAPGVAVARVALAGAIIPEFERFIVTPSLHAAEFGVGTTVRSGSMLVLASPTMAGLIVPSRAPLGISGVESGTSAPLVGRPPGVELHPVVDELPSGDAGDMVPVVLPIGVPMVPAADADNIDGIGGGQVTTVPGVVGSSASGTGASVVSRVPGSVAAENGLGPFSGDETIAAGVDGLPMAVVPIVETCARLGLQITRRVAVVSRKRLIAIPHSSRSS